MIDTSVLAVAPNARLGLRLYVSSHAVAARMRWQLACAPSLQQGGEEAAGNATYPNSGTAKVCLSVLQQSN